MGLGRIEANERIASRCIWIESQRIQLFFWDLFGLSIIGVGMVAHVVLMPPYHPRRANEVHNEASHGTQNFVIAVSEPLKVPFHKTSCTINLKLHKPKIRPVVAVMHDVDAKLGVEEAKDHSKEKVATDNAEIVEDGPEREEDGRLEVHERRVAAQVVLIHVLSHAALHGAVELRLERVEVLIPEPSKHERVENGE